MINIELQKEWNGTYSLNTQGNKNKYPTEYVVSFILGTFGHLSMEDRKNIKILDVGCGWGNNLQFLLDEGFDAYGIDISSVAIESLKQRGFKNVFVMDAKSLRFSDKYFDVIIDRSSIQHNLYKDLKMIYSEIYRVIKKEGVFWSMYFKTDNNNFKIKSLLTEDDLLNFLKDFKKVDIDYLIYQTKEKTKENYIIKAYK